MNKHPKYSAINLTRWSVPKLQAGICTKCSIETAEELIEVANYAEFKCGWPKRLRHHRQHLLSNTQHLSPFHWITANRRLSLPFSVPAPLVWHSWQCIRCDLIAGVRSGIIVFSVLDLF
jgi:hypothetical protein